MDESLRIRPFAPREWKIYRGLRLRSLADAPDAFGRTLAEEQERPDAEWSSRLSAGASSGLDLPLVAEVGGEPIGLAWGRIEASNPDVANLYQMWVAPSHRRLGVGRSLLETVIAWASAMRASVLELGVAVGNGPAVRLYRGAGFEPAGEPRPFRQGSGLLGQKMRLELGNSWL